MHKLLLLLLFTLAFVGCGAPGEATAPPQTSTQVGGGGAVGSQPGSTQTATGTDAVSTQAAEEPTEPAGEATEAATLSGETTTVATGEARVAKQYSSAPAMTIDPNKRYTATIETSEGTMTAELYAKDAPLTVNNFVTLARDGYYDGIIFHRVIPGFVIQGGDPTGTGSGGPGYQFPDEPVKRPYETGSLAMANAGPDTNGSQFFVIAQGGAGKLQPLYNHFGKLTQGQDVVERIVNKPTDRNDKPLQPVTIQTIRIEE